MWSLNLIVACVILQSGFKLTHCGKETCKENEKYVDNVNPCNDCKYVEGTCEASGETGPGCDCIDNFFRNEDEKCVEKSSCFADKDSGEDDMVHPQFSYGMVTLPKRTKRMSPVRPRTKDVQRTSPVRPIPFLCRDDEEYQECGCIRTCCNKGRNENCAAQCTRGCFCKGPLVRNDVGGCVKLEDCGKGIPTEQCGSNEVYNECGTACPKTCDNRNYQIKCINKCVKGCFCKEGYVKNDKGKCVKPYQCPSDTCGANEVYKDCGTACPKTCANRNIKIRCIDKCVEGCFCKDGYVRSDDGLCVEPNQCPADVCGINEVYKDCGPACTKTCANRNIKISCIDKCVEGCFCKDGYVKSDDGICVEPSQCPAETCRDGEEYTDCGTACPLTCDNMDDPPAVCTLQCVPGCFCQPGLVRNGEGRCVEPYECPADVCGANEVYKECGTACPKTCDNRNKAIKCISKCVEGCFCKDGYVQNNEGTCVKPDQCPAETCKGDGEEYSDCGSACPLTCDNKDDPPICILMCVQGCFCKKGLVRDDRGRCVEPGKCPVVVTIPPINECGKDKQFYECMPTCHRTCDALTRKTKIYCTQICKSGCFCKEGLYQTRDGKCVLPEECSTPTKQPDVCGKHEVFKTCGTACPETCSTLDKRTNRVCTRQCVRGCFCEDGYVKNDQEVCVKPRDCSKPTKPPQCGRDEQFYGCIPDCKQTCEAYADKGRLACKTSCRPGCYCRKGLYKRKDGKCVKPSKCDTPTKQPETCPKNEEFSTCANPCNNCQTRGKCQFLVCNKGCDCKKGYHRDESGKCIPASWCPIKNECGKNEEYKTCGTACEVTCSNRFIKISCVDKCVEGCFCKEGYIKNDDGKCVDPSQCPTDTCPINEEYTDCVIPCNDCETKGDCEFFACNKGCDCKYGFYRDLSGKCIPESQCPIKETCLIEGEEYTDCGTACPLTCSNKDDPPPCTKQCIPGCFCRPGLVRSDEGRCVEPEQCPSKEICLIEGEEYTDCGSACPLTCSNKDNPPICTLQCVPGCFCRNGLVRNNEGKCVEPKKCPTTTLPPYQECGKDEQYYDCMPGCQNTCFVYTSEFPIACKYPCRPGCFCKEGLYQRNDGKCVPPNKCPRPTKQPDVCGINEVFKTCGTSCPDTCSNRKDTNRVCTKQCVRGCFCRDGYVKSDQGMCVEPSECPPVEECGLNEAMNDCAKPKTCNTCEIRGNCKLKRCIRGCDCLEGYYRDSTGVCMPASQCPATCGINEEYTDCVIPCNDCETKGDCEFLVCNKGCDCKHGFYKDPSGKCIPESQCPIKETCQLEGEEYTDCGTACPLTCSNKDDPPPCTRQCVPGCFCRPGLVRSDEGRCVEPEQCPPKETCLLEGEEYTDCGTSCPLTCSNKDNPPICTLQCVPGCFCRNGLVRNDKGRCVKPYECSTVPTLPPNNCGKDEQFYECMPTCHRTCDALTGSPRSYCSQVCRSGCFCKDGLYKRKDGKCVPQEDCTTPTVPTVPPQMCGENEQYYRCVPNCKNTCENYNSRHARCSRVCNRGCACKKGYVKRKDGKCVKPSQCDEPTKPTIPPTQKCGKDEEFYGCIPTCKATCESLISQITICPKSPCRSGCFCRKGLVKRKDGKCVKPIECSKPTKPTKPTHTCGADEQYYSCVPTCKHTCDNYKDRRQRCTRICRPGCYCKKGLVKRQDGKCVEPSQCDEPTKPPTETCAKDEQYYQCAPDCKNTCANYNRPDVACPKICRRGCFCKEGLVKREDGKCVKPSKCNAPTKPPTPTCDRKKNEQYYECTPNCKNTCENYDRPNVICPYICKSGCFCKEGYVKRKDGKCVKPAQCEAPTKPTKPPTCGVNEEYSGCIPTCRNTCENYEAVHPICSRICIRGCHCKKGYVKRKDGKCVRPSQCGEPTKPTKSPTCDRKKNEQYYKCTPDCTNTCENYNRPGVLCPAICKSGCFCRKGYVKRKDGKCVRPSQCEAPTKPTKPPHHTCGKNEKYYSCVPTCKDTCENYDDKHAICPLYCRAGCACKEGYVKNKHGKCVKISQCQEPTKPTKPPHGTCGKNEEYYDCVPTCKDTCENYDDKYPICTKICRSGCACKEGYVKSREGKCVKPSQCQEPTEPTKPPHHTCGKNEKYYSCVPTCKDTCENYDDEHAICPLICRSGCACKEGYVKNGEGKCIKPTQCPEPTKPTKPPHNTCGKNEKYYSCVPTCKDTCENYDDEHAICPLYCRAGCACKEGYVKNKHGKCVKTSQCQEPTKPTKPPHSTCGKNEKYYNCVPTCKDTCENYDDKHAICTKICRSGCACKEGYVKSRDGKCVKPSQCQEPTKPTKPPHHTCGKDEKYYECMPTCKHTCENCHDDNPFCPLICRPGCYCKEGLVKRKDGKCVKPSQCEETTKPTKPPHHTCGKDEKYYECMPTCKHTCENCRDDNPFCPLICRPGCYCKEGFVKRKDGKCVKPSQCDEPTKPTKPSHTCGKDEVYYDDCAPSCGGTCDTYGDGIRNCPLCQPGCWCKKGYVKNKDGKCIKPSKCPAKPTKPSHTCDKDEVYYEDCAPSCGGTCDTYGDGIRHCPLCRPGCWCKKGYVKNKDGKCIKPSKCPAKPTKPPTHTCGVDEKYYECVPTCRDTCENYDDDYAVCPEYCRPGCACKEGLVKRKDGKCVKPSKCDEPAKPTGTPKPTHKPTKNPPSCGKYEVYYNECAPSCRGSCDTLHLDRDECPKCKPGCWCKRGLVKNKDGKCIPPIKCHTTKPTKPSHSCGKDEIYYDDCAPSCHGTCDTLNRHNIFCIKCKPGCWCKKGYVKNDKGKCIPSSKCPSATPPTSKGGCGKHKEFYECYNSCKNSCALRTRKHLACPAVCERGCFCKKGLLSNGKGKCVRPEECDKSGSEEWSESYSSSEEDSRGEWSHKHHHKRHEHRETGWPGKGKIPGEKCKGKNEAWVKCSKPKWCNTCGIRGNCKLTSCTPGCDCKENHFRDGKEKCIPAAKCPKDKPTGEKCDGINEAWVKCSKPKWCNTCGIRGNCKLTGCTPGCDCKENHFRDDKGKCTPAAKCPKDKPTEKCAKKGEEYTECGSACPLTCSNKDDVQVCTLQCVPGCFCKKGLIRNGDGNCIEPSKCSGGGEKCGKNEEFSPCSAHCQKDCSNWQKDSIPCTRICKPGCVCKKGWVKGPKGDCIEPKHCRKANKGSDESDSSEKHWSSESSEEWTWHNEKDSERSTGKISERKKSSHWTNKKDNDHKGSEHKGSNHNKNSDHKKGSEHEGSIHKTGSKHKGSVHKKGSEHEGSEHKRGSEHKGSIHKKGSENEGFVHKTGSQHKGSVHKKGSKQEGSEQKRGSQHKGSIHKKGSENEGSIHITGSEHKGSVHKKGSENEGSEHKSGSQHKMSVHKKGSEHEGSEHKRGSEHKGSVHKKGSENEGSIHKTGSEHKASINKKGSENEGSVRKTGSERKGSEYQIGSGHKGSVLKKDSEHKGLENRKGSVNKKGSYHEESDKERSEHKGSDHKKGSKHYDQKESSEWSDHEESSEWSINKQSGRRIGSKRNDEESSKSSGKEGNSKVERTSEWLGENKDSDNKKGSSSPTKKSSSSKKDIEHKLDINHKKDSGIDINNKKGSSFKKGSGVDIKESSGLVSKKSSGLSETEISEVAAKKASSLRSGRTVSEDTWSSGEMGSSEWEETMVETESSEEQGSSERFTETKTVVFSWEEEEDVSSSE